MTTTIPTPQQQRSSCTVSRSTIDEYIRGTDGVVGSDHNGLIQADDAEENVILSVRGRPPPAICTQFARAGRINSGEMDGILGSPHSIVTEQVRCMKEGPYIVTNVSIASADLSLLRNSAAVTGQNPAWIQDSLSNIKSGLFADWDSEPSFGREVIRRLHYLGGDCLAVEQHVTFLPYQLPSPAQRDSWAAFILNDSSTQVPTCATSLGTARLGTALANLHVKPNSRGIALSDKDSIGPRSVHPDPCESRRHLRVVEGVRSRGDPAAGTPASFYMDMVATSRRSWNRVLGFIEHRQEHGHTGPDQPARHEDLHAVYLTEQLKLDKALAARAEDHAVQILQDLRGPARELIDGAAYPDAVRAQLLRGHEYSLAAMERVQLRARRVQTAAQERLATELAAINIRDAKRSIEAAERMEKLTLLAFFFLPASFFSSFFGMNMYPLTNDGPGLWVFFAVTVPVLLLIAALFYGVRLTALARRVMSSAHWRRQSSPRKRLEA